MYVLDALGLPGEPGSLYEVALTHRSYAYEQPVPLPHNERLEFLGDAVLAIIVSDLVYRTYPGAPEGAMVRLRSAVVNNQSLATLARDMGLGRHLRLGRGEEASGGREKESLLADALEAGIGAAYLERGLEAVRTVLTPIFLERVIHERDRLQGGVPYYDAKTALQETAVRDHGERPLYRVFPSGPDHDKRYVAQAYVKGERCGTGKGRSKKEAEQNAAREALARITASSEEDLERVDPVRLEEGKSNARAS